jgi:hypothetical protein
MTARCSDLDLFFDGELETDQAAEFRNHLPTCERCQRVLHGRMQEEIAAAGSGLVAAPTEVERSAEAATTHDGVAAAGAASRDATRVASTRAPVDAEPVADAGAPVPRADATAATGRHRRMLAYVASAAAAAVALPLLWPRKQIDGPLALSNQIEHGSARARGMAHVGDILRSTARGERHRAIWVYFEKGDLRAACPGNGQCSEADGELVLRVTLKEPGVYTVVALGSDNEIPPPAPGKSLDELLATQGAGVHHKRDTVEVD